ncbi:uncharacterized protein LOC105698586 [Orussus abietinus]|uniref:uncharacterized protein LOC105698586 n=1 Tax=Orussus abietinus TaxID=222816 RepID=UPI000625D8A7|nr:uncharacterized protein LOC105698586 [Orussus abietinus]
MAVSMTITPASDEVFVLKLNNYEDSASRSKKCCGFHLSRSKWDPYPWIGSVERGSIAEKADLKSGDCLLSINGTDVVGLRVKEIASLIRTYENDELSLRVFRSNQETSKHSETAGGNVTALEGPLPEVAKKLANAISGTVRALECPVCLESAASPVSQCVHGHILCVGCRPKASRCPVCRVRLGQGRCLLADQIHRSLREAFDIQQSQGCRSLREKIFGKNRRTESAGPSGTKPERLLTKLLKGFDKAASAENLSCSSHGNSKDFRSRSELSVADRTKSASTGELSPNSDCDERSPSRYGKRPSEYEDESPRLSQLQVETPVWGGSIDSVTTGTIKCPLGLRSHCNEMLTQETLMDHLGKMHEGPQVHFYGGRATIPVPLPFGQNAIYLLHHGGEVFLFQQKDEVAWITASSVTNSWEWSLRGWGENGTEIRLRKDVMFSEGPPVPLPRHLAPIPKALSIRYLDIQLLDGQSEEGLQL